MAAGSDAGAASSPQGPDRHGIDVATVVYRREIPLLALQARSMALYLDPEAFGRIFVLVNDRNEADCVADVEALRSQWGPFASRVEVLGGDAVFAGGPRPRGATQRIRRAVTRRRVLWPFGIKSGWRGNRGWAIQQAMKLRVGRLSRAPFVLLLDAKNHFIRPVGAASFVGPTGRAKCQRVVPGDKQRRYILASFRRLGLEPPAHDAPAPRTVTPVCLPRCVLNESLADLEARVGAVEDFFARKTTEESEFMLIYASVVSRHGDWSGLFEDGLTPAATLFRNGTMADLDAALDQAERGGAEIFSVHGRWLSRLDPGRRARVEALWRERGLD